MCNEDSSGKGIAYNMKILLINPPIREWARPNVFPLGLGYIAAVLQDIGHKVEVIDINAYRWNPEQVEEKIKNIDFDVVGIGAIVTVYKYVKWLIAILKNYHPAKEIIIGGSVGTSIPRIILEKTEADIVCIGEGEDTIVEVVDVLQAKKNLDGIEGIWFKGKNDKIYRNPPRSPIEDLNRVPFPSWDLFPMDIYLKNPVGAPNKNKWINGGIDDSAGLSINISATRGCPYKCIYCYHDFMGQGYRYRPSENIVEEIKVLSERYGVGYIHFIDDEFVLNKDFCYDFCKAMKSEFGRKITWGCSGRVNLMTEDLIATMKDAGCVLIGYGIESGSQKMLDVMKKGVTVQQAKQAIRWTQKHLGWADASFIIGTPGETRETLRETVDFCKDLNLAPEVIFFMTPYPGSELYRLTIEQGKIINEEEYVLNLGEQGEKIRVNFTDIPDKELHEIHAGMIKELGAWNKVRHMETR